MSFQSPGSPLSGHMALSHISGSSAAARLLDEWESNPLDAPDPDANWHRLVTEPVPVPPGCRPAPEPQQRVCQILCYVRNAPVHPTASAQPSVPPVRVLVSD